MFKWLKNRFVQFLIVIGFLGVASAQVPILPVDMVWVKSYETVAFDTTDGDLGINEYALKPILEGDGQEYYIRNVPKNQGQFVSTVSLDVLIGKKQVNVSCENCAYYDEFRNRKGNIVRVSNTQVEYNKLRFVKDHPQPIREERVSVTSAATTEAAIAFDAAGEDTECSSCSSTSWSHTVVSATNGVVIVNAFTRTSSLVWSTTASTFNGTAMTRKTLIQLEAGANDQVTSLYSLVTAGEGTGSKTVSIAIESGSQDMIGTSQTYTGVDQTTPVDGETTSSGDNGDAITVDVTSAVNDLVVGFGTAEDEMSGVGGGQSERTDVNPVFTDNRILSSDEAGGSTVTHSYTRSGSATKAWSVTGINLNLALDPPTVTTQTADTIIDTSATMNGTLVSLGSISSVDAGFVYGVDSAFGATSTTKVATTSTGTYSESIGSLTTFEEYGFAAYASSSVGLAYGATYQFFTADISTSTPVVSADNHAWDLSVFGDGTHSSTTVSGTALIASSSPNAVITLIGTSTLVQLGSDVDEDITLPSTPQENDLVIIYGAADCANAGNLTVTTAGYTSIDSQLNAVPDAIAEYKVMGSSPDSVVNVQPSDCDPNARDTAWIVELWRRVDPDNPLDATRTIAGNTTGMPDSPSITTVTDGAVVISAGFLDDDDIAEAATAPSGYSNITAADSGASPAGVTTMVASKLVASAGAENPGVFGGGGTDAWRAVTIALRPGAAFKDGDWTSASWNVGAVDFVDSSWIEFSSTTPLDSTVKVMIAVNSSADTAPSAGSFTEVTSGGNMSAGGVTGDLTGKFVWVRIELGVTDTSVTPSVTELILAINDGVAPSGTRRIIITD